MSLVLRLARFGRKKRPFYRIVVADKESRRDGRFIEVVGTYNPMTETPTVEMKEERVKYWIGQGAGTTDRVRGFVIKQIPGYLEELEEKRRSRIQARRKARKQRAAAKAA